MARLPRELTAVQNCWTWVKWAFILPILVVHTRNSREDFTKGNESRGVIHNHYGEHEIIVVNLHKFKIDSDVVCTDNYNVNIEHIHYHDEAHRSYNPKGYCLANLKESDSNATKIGLTDTLF